MTAEEREKLKKQVKAMAEELNKKNFSDRNRERVWLFSNAFQLGLTWSNGLQPTNQQIQST